MELTVTVEVGVLEPGHVCTLFFYPLLSINGFEEKSLKVCDTVYLSHFLNLLRFREG